MRTKTKRWKFLYEAHATVKVLGKLRFRCVAVTVCMVFVHFEAVLFDVERIYKWGCPCVHYDFFRMKGDAYGIRLLV